LSGSHDEAIPGRPIRADAPDFLSRRAGPESEGVPMARGWTGAMPDQIIAICWLYL
jgi:hypothetical protein